MTTTAALIARARLELGDQSRAFRSTAVGDGVNDLISLPFKPVDPTTLTVTYTDANGSVSWATPANYTLDDRNGLLLLAKPLPASASLLVEGNAFRYFSDTDWTTFVTTALAQHTHGTRVTVDTLPVVEEYPVALLSLCQALYALLNDASFDIDISTPEGISIPRHQRVEQLSQMLATRLDQYNKLAAALNVGLNRIEMFDLRRVSLTTGKLVPIYVPQEYEDSRPWDQVFPNIDALDTSGRLEPIPTAPTQDLIAYSQQDFTTVITLNQDVTNYTVKASIRKYPQALQPLAVFKVTVLNASTGQIQISMDRSLTYFVGLAKFWDMELVDSTGQVFTVYQGRFDAVRQGTYG